MILRYHQVDHIQTGYDFNIFFFKPADNLVLACLQQVSLLTLFLNLSKTKFSFVQFPALTGNI